MLASFDIHLRRVFLILKGFVKGATAAPSGAIAGAAVISQMDADHYGSVAKIATASGARKDAVSIPSVRT